MRVKELIELLSQYNDELPVVVRHRTSKKTKQRDVQDVDLVKDYTSKETILCLHLSDDVYGEPHQQNVIDAMYLNKIERLKNETNKKTQ